ncbi:Chlorophyllide a oxygenase [Hibiscus syriacus]|uniref:Chlorophyllide a oxygenase n=1 Tax=Hibiscus syriacus TaxID=106335 RepID=A0A6A2Z1D9_HIBSY|nr:Chlorophyllide a oxygenase [Hibiscus syriacus]
MTTIANVGALGLEYLLAWGTRRATGELSLMLRIQRLIFHNVKGSCSMFYQALERARYDIWYCDWRARQDVLTIMLHEKVVQVLNPLAREYKSIRTTRKELAVLQGELEHAQQQVHIFEGRVAAALGKLACMEELAYDKLLEDGTATESNVASSSSTPKQSLKNKSPRENLDVSDKIISMSRARGNDMDLAGDNHPSATLPPLRPPGFEIHAEVCFLYSRNTLDLLDVLHAPFVHTSTFSRGWTVPSSVKFLTPVLGLRGYWNPYPIDMEFRPHCMMLATIGISKPVKMEGQSTKESATHLHQLYVLNEDMRLIMGQQERMVDGANIWNVPVEYDKLGFRYRLWRKAVEQGAEQLPFSQPTQNF